MIEKYKITQLPDDRPSSHRRGYGASHRRLRLVVLREEPICRVCRTNDSREMDHIDGNARNAKRSNLQGLCRLCHGRKTVREQGALNRKGK